MMTANLLLQLVLDSIFLSLCCFGLLVRGRGVLDLLLPAAFFVICCVTRQEIGIGGNDPAFVILPADSLLSFVFLFLAVLILNSIWFHQGEGHIFFGTISVFSLYLLLRGLCLAVFFLCGLRESFWYLYAGRVVSILLWVGLWAAGALNWLRERLADGDVVPRIIVCDVAALLLLVLEVFRFDLFNMLHSFSIVAGVLALLILGNGIVLLVDQYRVQAQRKIRLLEQYLPLVEELVEQVRARQHEFNNQIMGISAALAMADDLEEARRSISELLENAMLQGIDRELLRCDSKIISGMLFGKVKQAEMKHVSLEADISGAFLHRSFSEADWVELLGILIDNALEAASPGAVLYVQVVEEDGKLRVTVSNPCRAFSNVEFLQMFRRGWSTKIDGAHGYGLFNVRKMTERHRGKIITRNETIHGISYVTIGALIP